MSRSALGAFVGVAFLAWLACAATIPARADELAAARKAIEAQYTRLDAALTSDRPTALTRRHLLDGVATRDFRFVDANGKEWGSPWIPTSFGMLTTCSAVQHVAIEGNTVRAVVSTVREATSKQGRDKYRVEQIAHDTWIKTRTQWRLHRSVTVHSKTWVNDVLTEDLTAKPPLQPALHDAIVGELRVRAIPLKAVTAGAGFDDLAVLDQIIGDARIVALGEASHGTAEFFRLKHRLFEYLVERKGFTVFAFEVDSPRMEIVDHYVKTGQGTAAAALKETGLRLARTQEMRDLIEWVRAYNAVPGRSKLLSFAGFNIANYASVEVLAQCVINALGWLGASEAEAIRHYYAGTKDMLVRMHRNPPHLSDAKLRADVADALVFVEARREALLQVLTPTEYRRAYRCAALLVQASLPGANTDLELDNARDRAMAENVRWLVEEAFPNEKIVLWAHNGHVAAATPKTGFVPMGLHLRRTFGEQMRILGLVFDRGEVRAIPSKDGKFNPDDEPIAIKVPAAMPDTAEALLRATGLPSFILDLRTLPAASPLGTWMAESQRLRFIGSVLDPDDQAGLYQMIPLPKAFEALVFIEESTATVPLK